MTDASSSDHAQTSNLSDFRSKYGWFIGVGVLLLALGAYALFNLFAATIASVFVIGVMMIIGGGARVVHAFQVEKKSALLFWLISGALYVVAGVMALMNPVLAAAVFTLLLAASLIASGVIIAVASFSTKVEQGRWWIFASGVVTTLTGLILAVGWPLSGVWALGLILALDLSFQGASLIACGLAIKQAK
jgi:uncharacterized membrane protein HdeD (DUF308 family)